MRFTMCWCLWCDSAPTRYHTFAEVHVATITVQLMHINRVGLLEFKWLITGKTNV